MSTIDSRTYQDRVETDKLLGYERRGARLKIKHIAFVNRVGTSIPQIVGLGVLVAQELENRGVVLNEISLGELTWKEVENLILKKK